ncbi:hypothetical protein VTK56DRAFT_1611 [Thermocarpiscus australiensis]
MCKAIIGCCSCLDCAGRPDVGRVLSLELCETRQSEINVADIRAGRGRELVPCASLEFDPVDDPETCRSRPRGAERPGPSSAAAAAPPAPISTSAPGSTAAAPEPAGPSTAAAGADGAVVANPSLRKRLPDSRPPLPVDQGPPGDWTYKETMKLLLLRTKGTSFQDISGQIPGRDAQSCMDKLAELGQEHGFDV